MRGQNPTLSLPFQGSPAAGDPDLQAKGYYQTSPDKTRLTFDLAPIKNIKINRPERRGRREELKWKYPRKIKFF
jgi:hypothetical protein